MTADESAARRTGSSDPDRPAPGDLGVRMLHDRVLVSTAEAGGERRSSAGIVIPATAAVGKRLVWAVVMAVGQHVRQVQLGDRVLFDPEDRGEVELAGREYVLLRERDLHAVAEAAAEQGRTGLYL
ncbi:co-chaperone GroES [uncultured Pseudokineococcus sp.]|uniref:GroES family chaperonin n=1 Tax=uncultured Pseudokineococcus sp. TaxID=1642928 RepID=UPI0026350C80|nr:co-chaperone GroES [uncultured Pseudokineococcus sp.]